MLEEKCIRSHFRKAFILTYTLTTLLLIFPIILLHLIFSLKLYLHSILFYFISCFLYLFSLHNHFINFNENNGIFIFLSVVFSIKPIQPSDWIIASILSYRINAKLRKKKHLTFISTEGLINYWKEMLPVLRYNVVNTSNELYKGIGIVLLCYRTLDVSFRLKFHLSNAFTISKILDTLRSYISITGLIIFFILCFEIIEITYIYNVSLPIDDLFINFKNRNKLECRFIGFHALRQFDENGNYDFIVKEYLKFELFNLNKLIKDIEIKLRNGKNKKCEVVLNLLEEYIYSVGILLNVWKVIRKKYQSIDFILDGDNLMMLRFLREKCVEIEGLYLLGINTQIYGDLEALK